MGVVGVCVPDLFSACRDERPFLNRLNDSLNDFLNDFLREMGASPAPERSTKIILS